MTDLFRSEPDTIIEQATQDALRDAGKRIKQIDETTRAGVRDRIREAIDQGMSPREAAEHVRSWSGWGEYRAERIARTETMFAYNSAAISTYGQFGVTHVVADDGDKDAECAQRHGGTFSINEAADIFDHPNGTLDWLPVAPGIDPDQVRQELSAVREVAMEPYRPPAPPTAPDGRMAFAKQVDTWPSSRPWERTKDDIIAGRVPGVKYRADMGSLGTSGHGGRVLAMADDAGFTVTDAFFELATERRMQVMYHEAGHVATSAFDFSPTMWRGWKSSSRGFTPPWSSSEIAWDEAGEFLADSWADAMMLNIRDHPDPGLWSPARREWADKVLQHGRANGFASRAHWERRYVSDTGNDMFFARIDDLPLTDPAIAAREAKEAAEAARRQRLKTARVEDVIDDMQKGDASFEDVLEHRFNVRGTKNLDGTPHTPSVIRDPGNPFGRQHEQIIVRALDEAIRKSAGRGLEYRLDTIRFRNVDGLKPSGKRAAADMGTLQGSTVHDVGTGIIDWDAQAITFYRDTANYIGRSAYAEYHGMDDFYSVVQHEFGHAVHAAQKATFNDKWRVFHEGSKSGGDAGAVVKRIDKELRAARKELKYHTDYLKSVEGADTSGWTPAMWSRDEIHKDLIVRYQDQIDRLKALRVDAAKSAQAAARETRMTRYAGESEFEDFAETFWYYVNYPAILREQSPTRYAWMDEVFGG